MSETAQIDLPAYKDWSPAAVRLMQGPIYSDDKWWDSVLRYQSPLADYVARIGLLLIVNEPEGLAYLRQLADDEAPGEYRELPRLFRRTRLTFDATVLCVLLRDALRRFEEEQVDSTRCVVEEGAIFESWKSFFPTTEDELKLRRNLDAAFKKLELLHFVAPFGSQAGQWEVRRILKARVPIQELERLREQLTSGQAGATSRGTSDSSGND